MNLDFRRTIVPIRLLTVFGLLAFFSMSAFGFPSARSGARMEYSYEEGKVILFGGATRADSGGKQYELAETWKWNGRRWLQHYPENSPAARVGHAMTYDSVSDRVLLFGGLSRAGFLSDFWFYKQGNWHAIDVVGPPKRRLSGFAFDPIRNRAILFGGNFSDPESGAVLRLFDTWEFDGNEWILIEGTGPAITGPSLVYDKARNEVIMLGQLGDGTVQTHRYTGSGWELLEFESDPNDPNAPVQPECAGQAILVYEDHNERAVFHGGICVTDGTRRNLTWSWDGERWTNIDIPVGSRGSAISAHAMAYDAKRRETVIYGGEGGLGPQNASARFRNDKWEAIEKRELHPGPRTQFVAMDAPELGPVRLFGGTDSTQFLGDLWQFSDGNWKRIVSPGRPTLCDYAYGTFDPIRQVHWVICDDMRTFSFDGETWTNVGSSNDAPRARFWPSVDWDPKSGRVAMFGGFDGGDYLNEIWFWDGSSWEKGDSKGDKPDGRILTTFFFDDSRNEFVVFGGLGRKSFRNSVIRYNDIFRYDGSRWTMVVAAADSAGGPSPRYGAQIGWDPIGQRYILFGGKDENEEYLNETWEWTGTNWNRIEPTVSPSPRMNGRMFVDPSTGKLTLYGGFAGAYFSEVWTFENDEWTLVPTNAGRDRGAGRP